MGVLPGSLSMNLACVVARAQTVPQASFNSCSPNIATKQEGARTCRRVANARAKFRLEQEGEFKPKEK